MKPPAVTLLLILAVPPFVRLEAGELNGVTLPDQIQVDSRTLVLNGMGLRQATFLKVSVYVAGLYLEAKSSDAEAILRSAGTKRLVMQFVRSVGRKDLIKAWDEGFEKNAGASQEAFKERIATLDSYMSDMPKGSVMSFTYLPDKGVVVEVQGAAKGTIPGADFAEAFYRIWLGADPPNPGLKEGLLGRNPP